MMAINALMIRYFSNKMLFSRAVAKLLDDGDSQAGLDDELNSQEIRASLLDSNRNKS
jgi:hypothetical protein